MSTHAALYDKATGRLFYVHFDGYPKHDLGVGMTLKRSYGTPETSAALFAHVESLDTDFSSLKNTLEESVVYGSGDRVFPETYLPEAAYAKARAAYCNYLYTWTGKQWKCQPIIF